jgi:hypothetical protein
MSLTYSQYVAELANLTVIDSSNANFQANLPSVIDYAELRIQRDLNLLQTVVQDTSTTTTSGTRTVTIPSAFVVVNAVNVITGTSRVPLTPVSRDVIDVLWPDTGQTAVPAMYSMVTQWLMLLGPTPNATYTLQVVGTQRFQPLSDSNTTTFISTYLPDLFLAASMVFMAGYMRDFGAQTDDPKMAQSWETQYQLLKASANDEELRKHYWASSWSPHPVSPAAQPQRG